MLQQRDFTFSCTKQIYTENKINLHVLSRWHLYDPACLVHVLPHVTHSKWLFAVNPRVNLVGGFDKFGKQKWSNYNSEQLSFPGFSISVSFWTNQTHGNWLLKIKYTGFSNDVLGNIIYNFYFTATNGEWMKTPHHPSQRDQVLHLKQWQLMSVQLMFEDALVERWERHSAFVGCSVQDPAKWQARKAIGTCYGSGEF